MADITRLIEDLARREQEIHTRTFIAPCVSGFPVRTRICRLVHTFKVRPDDFSGWGIFRPENPAVAVLARRADRRMIDSYLAIFRRVALRLIHPLDDRGSWLAFPANGADTARRLGRTGAVAVHLVEDAARFDMISARWDGAALWFQGRDFSSDPILEEYLRSSLAGERSPDGLSKRGLTPEDHIAYETAFWREMLNEDLRGRGAEPGGAGAAAADRRRIGLALKRGGGRLIDLRETQDGWRVEWASADGNRYSSHVSGGDLTVVGAGICLSGEDRKFDLQSLVGVVEGREE